MQPDANGAVRAISVSVNNQSYTITDQNFDGFDTYNASGGNITESFFETNVVQGGSAAELGLLSFDSLDLDFIQVGVLTTGTNNDDVDFANIFAAAITPAGVDPAQSIPTVGGATYTGQSYGGVFDATNVNLDDGPIIFTSDVSVSVDFVTTGVTGTLNNFQYFDGDTTLQTNDFNQPFTFGFTGTFDRPSAEFQAGISQGGTGVVSGVFGGDASEIGGTFSVSAPFGAGGEAVLVGGFAGETNDIAPPP